LERGSIISALVANGILLGGAYGMGRLAQGESTEHSWALNTLFFNLPGGAYSIGKIMARNKNIKEERARMNDQPQPVRH
jgi:hypothetical protein